jgi:Ca2+-binding EF-hand superfamily protein
MQPNEIKAIFKEFDKSNQGFFRYESFVEFIFGVKQLSSEKGYLNNISLVLQ